MLTLNHKPADIDKKLAEHAFNGTSMIPEKRGAAVINDYVTYFDQLQTEFSKFANDENQAEIEADLERFRQGYVKRLTDYLYSHSNVISPLVTGPANFPVRRNQKRSRWADNKMAELIAFDKKVLKKLRRKYDPKLIAYAPISLADDDATAKLQDKLDKAQAFQDLMKAANQIIRKKQSVDQKVEQLKTLGLSDINAHKLLTPDYMNRLGFPHWQLQNNNANIRRMKQRLEQLKREQDRPAQDTEVNGVQVIENKDLTRLQLIFPDKPPIEVRTLLKRNGFRWSPRNGAWQRLLNDNARYAAKQVLSNL